VAPRVITPVGDGAALNLGRTLDRLGLEEGHEIGLTEATLALATDSKACQPTVVGPTPERGLADVEELRGLLDVQETFGIR
jgi:hypothetical protein